MEKTTPESGRQTIPVNELLATLAKLSVRLWIDGDQLRVDAPKGVLTPDLLQAMKACKSEVMAHLAANDAPVVIAESRSAIRTVDRNQPLRLSSAQERLWSLEQLNPQTSLYNITEALRLRGTLNVALLEESIRQVVERQEILRTAFLRDDTGQARLQISAGAPAKPVEFQRLQCAPVSVVESNLRKIIDTEAKRPFDLAHSPLLRCVLAEIDESDHLLVVTMHHIVSDALSFAIFMGEVSEIYLSLQKGMKAQLPALPLQYADYAGWQQQSLREGALESQRSFWEARLGDDLQPLQLPTDLARYATNYEAGRHSLGFAPEMNEKLRSLARQEKVTLFVLVLAAFQTLLNRYSGQEDLLVCVPASGRNRVELENLIGYFNNILVLRSDLSGNPTFRELVQRERKVVMEASDWQEIPFAEVASLPSLRRVPLNRVLFELREASEPALHLPGIAVKQMVVEKGSSDFDLFVIVYEREGELSCVVHSKRDLFSDEAIQKLMENFQQLLTELLANPDQSIGELPQFERGKLQSASDKNQQPKHNTQHAPESLIVQLTQIWQQVLGLKTIGIHDNFFELGGHSLLAVQLMAALEQQLIGEQLPLAMILQSPTIAQMAETLSQQGWRSAWSSLVPIQPKGTKPPFFFVHAHGGNVIGYYDLARHLGGEQPFYGLQAMGMDAAEKVTHRLEEMAAHYISEIRMLQPKGPYRLGGWCLGGDVAYEMAQQLQAQGEEVALLVMVHNPQPGYPRYLPKRTAWQKKMSSLVARIDREWWNFNEVENGKKVHYLLVRGRDLGQKVQIQLESRLDSLYSRFGLSHSAVYEKERLADAHLKAYAAYIPKPYAGDVVLIRANKQPIGTENDSALGWDRFIHGKLTICEVPGYPIGLLDEPRVAQVAAHLLRYF